MVGQLQLPNLELLRYMAKEEMCKICFGGIQPDIQLGDIELYRVFPQEFPNTAGLMSTPDGVSGQAITTHYISIFEHVESRIVVVFEQDWPVHTILQPNWVNLREDIAKQQLVPKYRMIERYEQCGRQNYENR